MAGLSPLISVLVPHSFCLPSASLLPPQQVYLKFTSSLPPIRKQNGLSTVFL